MKLFFISLIIALLFTAQKPINIEAKIVKTFTLDSLGACQGITRLNDSYFLYGDREVGVMREYSLTNDSLIYKGNQYKFTINGENIIKHPTGIAHSISMPTFVGNSIRQNAAGTVWKAFIYAINWERFLETKTLDGNLIKTIEDDACIQGCRPEYVSHKGELYLATADYGNNGNEVRLYHPDKLAKATKTSEKELLYRKFTCSPFVQNLHFIANKNILILIQNQIDGRRWRLSFLDLQKSIDQGHEVVIKVIDTDKADELEGFTFSANELKGIAVSSAKKENVSVLNFKYQ